MIFLELRISKVGFLLAIDFIQRRLGDIDEAFVYKRGHKPIEHGENERANMVAIHVGVGTDDDLAPVQVIQIEGTQILHAPVFNFDAAA